MEYYSRIIADAVRDVYGLDVEPEVTRPEAQFGDVSSNVAMKLSKQLEKNPREIASELAERIRMSAQVASAEVAGPGFLNITITSSALLGLITDKTISTPPRKIVIETNCPNPFKAMHIGHAYNAIIADTVANLLERAGNEVHRVSYHGDVGLHVGRSMYSLLRYVDGDATRLEQIPPQERNTFMSQMYAEGSKAYREDESAKTEIAELARQSFNREDPLYAAVYDTVFEWSFVEIDANTERIGNKPVEYKFLESEADTRGVKIVRDHTPGIFEESNGALIFRGSEHGGFDNVFVGSNGFGLYAARDLGLIELKRERYSPDKSYTVTAEEQKDYFKGVLAAAAQINPDEANVTTNISTGTVKLTSGKMSSREGEVIEIGWLFEQIADAIAARGGAVTQDVVAGALRYAFLRVRIGGDVVFDINESVSIQGNSGPYLQYAHARACSILQKAPDPAEQQAIESLDADERLLVRKITEYNDVVQKSTQELMPHHICHYLYELAQEFNRFYEKNRVLGHERQSTRLSLVTMYRDTLARGLELLGIDAPVKM